MCRLLDNFDNKDEKSATKFHYIKTVSGKVVAQSMSFERYQYIGRMTTASPEILAETDPPCPEGSEF